MKPIDVCRLSVVPGSTENWKLSFVVVRPDHRLVGPIDQPMPLDVPEAVALPPIPPLLSGA